ncbi:MAG: ACT domain-containing protein [Clostridia bacterium]|nr:ACT domain-containing protein [Clostridia bacterium]
MSGDYLLVRSDALPEVFLRVARANHLLQTRQVSSCSAAAAAAGISRSAFYKYRDKVQVYDNPINSGVITVQAILSDKPGILSGFISVFCDVGANILTVNQNIPIRGAAPVSVSARIDTMSVSVAQLLESLRALDGVSALDYYSG